MSETPAFLAERLKIDGDKMHAYFSALTPDQWQADVYTEGATWKIRSVLAHFVTAERAFVKLFADINNGGAGASPDFSIDRYNASQQEKTKELTPSQLLEQYAAIRAEMIAFVNTLAESDLAKQGRHPFLGMTTLGEMIKMVYRHNQIHLRDMRKITGE
jgi:hypothetical protein